MSLHFVSLIKEMWFVDLGFVAIDQAVLLEAFSLLQNLLEDFVFGEGRVFVLGQGCQSC